MKISFKGDSIFIGRGGVDWQEGLPTLILLHGAGMDRTVWVLHARYFARHGYNVVTPDLPGHGASSGELLTSVEDQASFVCDLLSVLREENGLPKGPVFIGGHSMGGLIATVAAAKLADEVQHLILFGAGYPMFVSEPLLNAAKANDQSAVDMIAIFAHSFQSQLGHNAVAGISVKNSAMALLERAGPGVLHQDLLACNSFSGLEQTAESLAAIPKTLIIGDADRMTPLKASKKLVGLIDGELKILQDCGHMVMLEQPETTLQAMRQILM